MNIKEKLKRAILSKLRVTDYDCLDIYKLAEVLAEDLASKIKIEVTLVFKDDLRV